MSSKLVLRCAMLASIFLMTLQGCVATHGGYLNNSASLGAPNFTYVAQDIRGNSTATYILGIGGIAKESLIANAKKAMLKDNPLKSNQALANVTVSYKASYYLGVVNTLKCTVTADIVEFR